MKRRWLVIGIPILIAFIPLAYLIPIASRSGLIGCELAASGNSSDTIRLDLIKGESFEDIPSLHSGTNLCIGNEQGHYELYVL